MHLETLREFELLTLANEETIRHIERMNAAMEKMSHAGRLAISEMKKLNKELRRLKKQMPGARGNPLRMPRKIKKKLKKQPVHLCFRTKKSSR